MAVVDRILSVLLALVLVALGVLIPVEVINALAGGTEPVLLPYDRIAGFFQENAWSSGAVIAIGVALAVVGLVLMVVEFWRRRPGLLAVETDSEQVAAGISPRSLSRVLTTAATDVGGITRAKTSVGRRRAVVSARTPLHDPGDLGDRARDRVEHVLSSLDLRRPLAVRVRLTRQEESS